MKYFFLFLMLVAGSACNKKRCWKCHIDTTTKDVATGATAMVPVDSTICDRNTIEIKAIEVAGNQTFTREEGGRTYEVKVATSCSKQ